MKRTWKQFISAIVAVVVVLTGIPFTQAGQVQAAPSSQGLGVQYHTQDEIMAYLTQQGALLTDPVTYKVQPSYRSPFALGELSDETLNSALAMFNQVRYIAGLSSVTLDASYNQLAQASSVTNAANNVLTHYPTQPAGMPDDMYQLGKTGSSSSNIAWNYQNLNKGIVRGWMEDGDASNIDRLGHRRWILNPGMKKTGFGEAGKYYAMYAFDGAFDAKIKGVIWPAQEMPVEYFGSVYPWSYSYGSALDASKIQVTLTRKADNKIWKFSSASADGYFNVENSNYGQPGCVIFRPTDVTYAAGDVFQVSITGAPVPVEYTVRFFSIGLAGHEHAYSITTQWSTDCHQFTAIATCGCGDTASIPGTVTWEDADGDCTIASWVDYKATFSWDGYNRTYWKSKYRSASAHAYGTPEFTWSGTTGCTVAIACQNDGCLVNHTQACTITEETVPATATTEGTVTAVAKAVIDGKEYTDRKLVKTLPVISNPAIPFTDVQRSDWFYFSVKEAYETGLMKGVTATTFEPASPMNRAMVVTVLHRVAGYPKAAYSKLFTDVASGQYYTIPVMWAAQNKIVNGYGDQTFRPMDNVTREQLAVMLMNFAKAQGVDVSKRASLAGYRDVAKVSGYATYAMGWAIANGIMSGTGAGELQPNRQATRAEATKMLLQVSKMIQK